MSGIGADRTGFWKPYSQYIVTQRTMLVHRQARKALYERMGIGPADSVLDAGCGRAPWSIEMALNFRPRRIVGLDFEPAMVRHAARRISEWRQKLAPTGISAVLGDMTALPFGPESFSRVISILGWGYQTREKNELAMREFARVGEPGALVGIFTLKRPEGGTRSIRDFGRFIREELRMKKTGAEEGLIDPFADERPAGPLVSLGAIYYTFVMARHVRLGSWQLPSDREDLSGMAGRAGLETVFLGDAYAGTGLIGVFRVP